jgi:plastocyanin
MTGTNGIATIGSWTLGDSPGSNSLSASAAGLTGSPVTFTAMATALPNAVTVEVRNHYFRSVRNGSGSEFTPTPFGEAAVDTIAVGGTVTWQWVGVNHNVTPYQNAAFTGSGTQDAPFTFGPITFNSAGTYRYRCTNHSSILDLLGLVGMRGEIVVR